MLPALVFLPAGDVIEGFEELVDTVRILYNDVADELLQYFEDTCIGRYRRNAPRRSPLFAINLWNMFNRTDHELPRTNNSVEGYHRSFQGHLLHVILCFGNFHLSFKKKKTLFVSRLSSILRDIQHHHQGNVIWIQAKEFLEYWTIIQMGKGFST